MGSEDSKTMAEMKKEADGAPSGGTADDDHDFEIIEKEDVNPRQEQQQGLWIGIDLGTSNCAAAIWDSERGSPKWMRLQHLAPKQPNGKVGRIVPSAVQIQVQPLGTDKGEKEDTGSTISSHSLTATDALWQDICKWNQSITPPNLQERVALTVGQKAMESLQQRIFEGDDSSDVNVIKSMKRVLGVCYSSKLEDLDPDFRLSLPFRLEETEEGDWVVPMEFFLDGSPSTIYLRPVHVAAILLQAIRQAAQDYLKRAIPKKKMRVPGEGGEIRNVVVGVPAYFGQRQRQAVEEAARLAGYKGHVSTLTESTAAAMAYGLFVGQQKETQKAILVLDMGGGTTDITIAHKNGKQQRPQSEDTPDQKFEVIITDGDSRLGGEDMDQALFDLVLKKASQTTGEPIPEFTPQQRQQRLRSCQQAKELLCGDVDHDEPPSDSAHVPLPSGFGLESMELTKKDLDQAIQPLLEQTAHLMERTLKRYADKLSLDHSSIAEVILIGGATRVPALRQMLKDKFFSDIELCTSVNAMSAVAQGAAIQGAILSKQVPLHELRSAMMLDTTPHAIGALLKASEGAERFVEVLPRDSPLPAQGYATFSVADLDQKGVTVVVVEEVEPQDDNEANKYQPLGDFSFLLHRLSESQRDAILEDSEHPGLRHVDIGMSLNTSGAFQVSIFDPNDPDHKRKKEFYQKSKQDETFEAGILDYVQAAADLKSEGMTMEEMQLIVVVALLFVFYIVVKVLLPKEDMMSEEDMARIL